MLQFLFIFELNILFGNMKKMSWGGEEYNYMDLIPNSLNNYII